MSKQRYFFCYDPKVSRALRFGYGIKFITNAIHPKTGQKFWLYERSDELETALSSIKQP